MNHRELTAGVLLFVLASPQARASRRCARMLLGRRLDEIAIGRFPSPRAQNDPAEEHGHRLISFSVGDDLKKWSR